MVSIMRGHRRARMSEGGRSDKLGYRRTMGKFLRKTGLSFLDKNDRACIVRILPALGGD